MALLDDVKQALRIFSTAYDSEVLDLVSTAKEDLGLSGILLVEEIDPLVKRAIILYAKAHFGYDNKDFDKLNQSYETIKKKLSLSTAHAYHKVVIKAGFQCRVKFGGQIKETNMSGEAVFYSKPTNNVGYSINNGELNFVDIKGDTVVEI